MSTLPPPLDCNDFLPSAELNQITSKLTTDFLEFATKDGIPEQAAKHLLPQYLQIAAWLAHQHKQLGRSMVLGINGSQGSGKSTLTKGLTLLMPKAFGLKVAGFSLDDVYHTRQTRSELAQQVHPLLATRGVPGTHEVALGVSLIKQLLEAEESDTVSIPFFDKAADDRVPESQWPVHNGSADIVIIEGWCVATPPQPDADLAKPINDLERLEDSSGAWRHFANEHLKTDYADWYAMIDRLIFLQIPRFEQVQIWRGKQEDKLRKKLKATLKPGETPPGLMTPEQLVRFISHYERLTRHTLQSLPTIADLIIKLSPDHRYEAILDAAKGRLNL